MAGDTPEALTKNYFESHINEYGVSVAANPLQCVWDRFDDQELERYSRAGDPVATLALVIKMNAREGAICNRFSNIERDLWVAFRLRQVVVNGHKISRVPEAPYFIDLIAQECEVERPNLSANSIDYGFDPSSDFTVVD
ncbi:hypothetical protein ABE453_04505 [Brevundimonas diminuta]|uniref:hypothetical protein n=1 Tax=Brevundimonas diminuta TaxID=293 RepID=UPI000F9238B7